MSFPAEDPAFGAPMTQPAPPVPPRPRLAVVTWTIIAVCFAVWLGELTIPGFADAVLLAPDLGAREPWRLLTSAFAHSTNILHIAFNMYALWSLGRPLEYALGRGRYAALYLLSALGGSVGFIVAARPPSPGNPLGTNWYTAVVGASGAVFGLFGAMIWLSHAAGVGIRELLWLLVLNAALPLLIPGIAWQAHVGGFVTGILAGAAITRSVQRVRQGRPDRTWWWLAVIGVLLVVLCVGRYMLAGAAVS